jgi:glycosyltransferase involved in cell wall biosynthesis
MQPSPNRTLVILTPGFPENEDDSTCVPPQQIFVKALQQVAPELTIMVLTFTYPFISKTYYWNGIEVIAFGDPKNRRLLRPFTAMRVKTALNKINKEQNIIGLLSFWVGKCALVGDQFAKKHHLKHYGWLLGQDAKFGNKYLLKIKPSPGSLIAISDFVADTLEKNYRIRPKHVIPVGVDPDLFQPSIKRDIDILGAGSLIPLKQYDVFLKVIALLLPHLPTLNAVICGDGPEMAKLQALIIEKKLQNHVQLAGRCSHGEVLRYMERSKVFMHPSNYEGFSTVCLEALYAGNQVVSFIKPMHFDIENWAIVNDTAAMADTVKSILESDIALKSVLPYNVRDNARKMLELFNY